MVERERRFLLPSLSAVPDGLLAGAPRVEITQWYLVASPDVAVRVRTERSPESERHTLTIKLPTGDETGSLGAVERVEVEFEVTPTQAVELCQGCGDRVIRKTRTRVPLEAGLVAEIDVFADGWAGLAMVEVEFVTRAALTAFRPPQWCGREVTSDVRFSNAALAVAGAAERAELLAIVHGEG